MRSPIRKSIPVDQRDEGSLSRLARSCNAFLIQPRLLTGGSLCDPRRRLKQDRVHDREDRGIRTNTDGWSKNRCCWEATVLAQHAQGVLQVIEKSFDDFRTAGLLSTVLRNVHCTLDNRRQKPQHVFTSEYSSAGFPLGVTGAAIMATGLLGTLPLFSSH